MITYILDICESRDTLLQKTYIILHDLTSTESRFNSIKFTLNQTLVQHTNVVIYPIDSAYVLGHFYKRGLIYS